MVLHAVNRLVILKWKLNKYGLLINAEVKLAKYWLYWPFWVVIDRDVVGVQYHLKE